MNEKPIYKDWLSLDLIEDYDRYTAYMMPRLETMPNKHNWYKNAFREHMAHQVPKAIYVAIRVRQIGKVNELDALIAHLRYLMRFSKSGDLRMLTNHQHETAETLLNVVGGKVGAYKKNIQANRV